LLPEFESDALFEAQLALSRFSGGDTPSLNRLLADRFFVALLEALQDVYATIKRGRNGQGS